jgi:hypothetical protein
LKGNPGKQENIFSASNRGYRAPDAFIKNEVRIKTPLPAVEHSRNTSAISMTMIRGTTGRLVPAPDSIRLTLLRYYKVLLFIHERGSKI